MQGLDQFRHRDRLPGNVLTSAASDAKHALELMREYFDKARKHFGPVVENVLRPLAAGELKMPLDQPAHQFYIARFDHGLEINRCQVTALIGEVSLFVENVSDTAAHAGSEISAAGTEH